MSEQAHNVRAAQRYAVGLLIFSILFSLTLLVLALAGISDPHPVGDLVIDDDLSVLDGWQVYPSTGTFEHNDAGLMLTAFDLHERVYLTAPYMLNNNGTIEITAGYTGGPTEAGYGLWWGAGPDSEHALYIMNSNGYLGVYLYDGAEQVEGIREWSRYVHVRPGMDENRIRVDLEVELTTLYLNDEWVLEFEHVAGEDVHFGLVVETNLRGGMEAVLSSVQVWEE